MKGVSAVIATILMLVITIALAGLAYSFMSGILTARTAVILSIDAGATQCSGNTITVYVKNEGTASASVTAYAATAPGGPANITCGTQTIASGASVGFTCTKTGGAGYYPLRATSTGATTSGSVYCAS
jgi:flagellin-like protein